jgi:hypothetical protein
MPDLMVCLDWIGWLNAAAQPFVVAITAAPPLRREKEAPFVRETRMALR